MANRAVPKRKTLLAIEMAMKNRTLVVQPKTANAP
jgi:hypothetical protein